MPKSTNALRVAPDPAKPTIRSVPVDELMPYIRNARTHSPEQVAQIAASITEFGFTNPILTDGRNGVVAGHGRLMAAKELGLDAVPVIELAHLTPDQVRAYVLADNKLALNAGWDNGLAALELAELRDAGFDLGLTGFSPTELTAFFAGPTDKSAPDEFGTYDEGIETQHCCPSCGYRWSGKSGAEE